MNLDMDMDGKGLDFVWIRNWVLGWVIECLFFLFGVMHVGKGYGSSIKLRSVRVGLDE